MIEAEKGKLKIGAVYSGMSYQHSVLFRDEYLSIMDILPVCEFGKKNFFNYDILIFPRGTDQEAVYAERKTIRKFLESKRILISFGEVTSKWIPGCVWGGVIPEDDGPLLIKKNHTILKGLKPDDLHWHKGATGWCCHGHLIAPQEAEILVTNIPGDAVMYIDRHSTRGIILVASQLDAICHAYHGISGAKHLFDNCLKWAIKETNIVKKEML